MKYSIFFLVVIMLTSCKTETKPTQSTPEVAQEMAQDATFYVGTYTDKESKGIYKYSLSADGKLAKIGLAATTNNPSFLALSPDKKFLLTVNEVAEKNTGFVSSYQIEKDTLLFKNMSSSGGAHPCHVAINDEGYVLAANYSSGSVGLLQVDGTGKLTDLLDTQQHTGQGTTARQKGPHAHSAWFDDNTVIAVDLGTNELWFSSINTTTNKLDSVAPFRLPMAEGAGPRHLVQHPTKKILYVLNELDNTITSLLKSGNGTYEKVQTISTIPEGFTGATKGADIHISDDGKFVYASNRGHNSIAIFSVNEDDGGLSLVGYESCRGENPRNFSLSPNNNFLIVANQDTNNLISFKRNPQTGLLTFVSEIEAPTPVCILFN
ncbi:lactonase family protein [Cellulophaga sp. Z1A5H]|uniref:lactonase family protein n=1 Tax=Cellulophaga sp. Z1A5H TaxID=2687291 RepID=UPI0013FD38A1|nr:lactonase family protein [Cellulophaga sp. Z1A5H]